MTKRRLTFQGYIDRLKEPSPSYPPPENVPPLEPSITPGWRKKIYAGTKDLGVYYTENFVLDTGSPLGVPTWTAINTGLPVGVEDLLDLTADPFNPEYRQYALYEDGVYVREGGGSWTQVLNHTTARSLSGGAGGGLFALDGISCNINNDGYIACLYNASSIGAGWAFVLLVSTNYGASWRFKGYIDGPTALGTWGTSLQVGAYQGTSPYGAGQVIYAVGRGGAWQRLYRSYDGGATWANTAIFSSPTDHDCLVDPSDQSRVFVGRDSSATTPRVEVSTDHGVTLTDYDLNASEPAGSGNVFHHLSVAMDATKTVRIGVQGPPNTFKITRDDGATWQEVYPQYSDDDLGVSLVQDSPDFLYLMRQNLGGNVGTNWHTIWASSEIVDSLMIMIPKSGANCSIIDTGGGDSIPYNCGGIRGIVEIWTDQEEVPGTPSTGDPIGRSPGPVPEHDPVIHDHSFHTDRTRNRWLSVGDFDVVSGAPTKASVHGNRGVAWLFDDTADELIATEEVVPQDWASGNISFRFYFTMAGNNTSRNAVLRLSLGAYSEWAWMVAGMNTTDDTVGVPNTADYLRLHLHTRSIPVSAGQLIQIQLGRIGSSGSDDAVGDLQFLGLEMIYTADM